MGFEPDGIVVAAGRARRHGGGDQCASARAFAAGGEVRVLAGLPRHADEQRRGGVWERRKREWRA